MPTPRFLNVPQPWRCFGSRTLRFTNGGVVNAVVPAELEVTLSTANGCHREMELEEVRVRQELLPFVEETDWSLGPARQNGGPPNTLQSTHGSMSTPLCWQLEPQFSNGLRLAREVLNSAELGKMQKSGKSGNLIWVASPCALCPPLKTRCSKRSSLTSRTSSFSASWR